MSVQDDGGPAFPGTDTDYYGQPYGGHLGMTLRDYFAAKALEAMIGVPQYLASWIDANPNATPEQAALGGAKAAYEYADAMLEIRKKS